MTKQPSLLFTVFFFLKTTLFNFVVNPTLAILIPFTIFFIGTQDIDKNALLVLMIIFTFTFQFIRSFNLSMQTSTGNTTNMGIFYKLLPIKSTLISKSLIINAVIYSIVIYGSLIFFLEKSLALPEVNEISISYNNQTAVTTFNGTYFDSRGLRREFTQYYYPSLFFGIIRNHNGWPVFPGYTVLLSLFFISITSLLLTIKTFAIPVKKSPLLAITTFLSITIITLVFLFFMGDLFFADTSKAAIRAYLENTFHLPYVLPGIFAFGILNTCIGYALIFKTYKEQIFNYAQNV